MPQQIIAICGRKQVGKDLMANFICDNYDYINMKFADPMKRALKELFNFTEQQIEIDKEIVDKEWGISPREAMQFFGCNVIQYEFQKLIPGIGRNFFVKSLATKIKKTKSNIVISDLRFIHEYKALKEQFPNIIIIKLFRPSIASSDTHISEMELDNIIGDFTIINDGTKQDLFDKTKNILYKHISI
jgi:hypothetical protein